MSTLLKKRPLNIRRGLITFSLVPISVIMCIIVVFISNSQVQKLYSFAENKFMRAAQEINTTINRAINFSNNVIANPNIVDIFRKNYSNVDENFRAAANLNVFFTNYYEKVTAEPSITIYHNNSGMYQSMFSRHIKNLDPLLTKKLKKQLTADVLWTENESDLCAYKALNDGDFMLVIQYTISKADINSTLRQFDVFSNTGYNAENKVLFTEEPMQNSFTASKALANEKYINMIFPKSLKNIIYIRNFVIFLGAFAFLTLLISILSVAFTKFQREKLSGFIDSLDVNGDLNELTHMSLDSKDVLFPVYRKILQLITDVNTLNERNNQMAHEKNMIELKYTQSQFNPHLLYNTLGVFKWKCFKQDPMLASTIDSMVDYYRSCISNFDETVTLAEEISLVEKYITLIEFTHERPYQREIDIESALHGFVTVKHLLQPFVENAILHGIQQVPDGYIKISAEIIDGFVVITIKDNGMGISKETLKAIGKEEYFSKYKSYGIKNTRARIRYFHGAESTIDIQSEEGKGTVVTISLPYTDNV